MLFYLYIHHISWSWWWSSEKSPILCKVYKHIHTITAHVWSNNIALQISTLSCCDFGLLVWICEIKAQILHRTRKIATLTGQKVVRDNLMCNFCTCTAQISLRTKKCSKLWIYLLNALLFYCHLLNFQHKRFFLVGISWKMKILKISTVSFQGDYLIWYEKLHNCKLYSDSKHKVVTKNV